MTLFVLKVCGDFPALDMFWRVWLLATTSTTSCTATTAIYHRIGRAVSCAVHGAYTSASLCTFLPQCVCTIPRGAPAYHSTAAGSVSLAPTILGGKT